MQSTSNYVKQLSSFSSCVFLGGAIVLTTIANMTEVMSCVFCLGVVLERMGWESFRISFGDFHRDFIETIRLTYINRYIDI